MRPHFKPDQSWWWIDGDATDIGAVDIVAIDNGAVGIGAIDIGIDIDIDIDHLGDQVDPGDAQAAHHDQHHHKAPAHKTVPVGQNAW